MRDPSWFVWPSTCSSLNKMFSDILPTSLSVTGPSVSQVWRDTLWCLPQKEDVLFPSPVAEIPFFLHLTVDSKFYFTTPCREDKSRPSNRINTFVPNLTPRSERSHTLKPVRRRVNKVDLLTILLSWTVLCQKQSRFRIGYF